MADIPELINILREARGFLQRGEGDYSWSSWEDESAALAELDEIIRNLLIGQAPPTSTLQVLFAPTGPMQEVSLSSGWGNEFVELADRLDQAIAAKTCQCLESHQSNLMLDSSLGMDENFGEVSILKCPQCDQLWLRYLYEVEGITRSGRWFECPISVYEKETLNATDALVFINSQPWFYQGGSYYDGVVSKSKPPVNLS